MSIATRFAAVGAIVAAVLLALALQFGASAQTGTATPTPTETATSTATATPSPTATPEPATYTYDLSFRWTNLTWFGADNIPTGDALSGTGDAAGGDDVSDIVTAVFGWQPQEQGWLGYFPNAVDIPGANDLETLRTGAAYWVAINAEEGAQWTIATDEAPVDEIHIGALLSITGPGATLGAGTLAALEIAVEEWNEHLEDEGRDERIVLDVEDSALDPDLAVEGFNALVAGGARIIIGAQSSAEVAALGDLADAEGVLLISNGSTASALSGEFSNVFRFVPNDRVEGRASVDLMTSDGAGVIVPVWRNDTGNQGLVDSVRAAATADGLTVTEGVSYEPGTTDFSATLDALAAQVTAAVGEAGAENVVVYLAGFEEVADLFTAAGEVEGLDDVRWYGADGSARGAQLIASEGSVAFATATGGYPSPLVALPEDAATTHAELIARIAAETGSEPDATALAAYDAFNVAVQALLDAGADAATDDLRAAFVAGATGYEGVTGTIDLTEGGDRASAPFIYWSICTDDESAAAWVPTGRWQPAADPTQPGTVTAGSCAAPIE